MAFTILITGGAGYIGSHTAFILAQLGYNLIILDAFLHNQIFNPPWATVIKGDIENTELLEKIFASYNINAVMHFAANIEVGESVKNPYKFYYNNVVKTLNLLTIMRKYNVTKFVFSSSCAVYGIPQFLPLTEEHSKNPISPYGKTKLMVEMMLEDFSNAYNLKYVSLRYFNAAGALPQQGLGEQHIPETHIIPLLFESVHQETTFNIFGNDYSTPDGTAIRDYVHVLDIAQAHVLALNYLENGNSSDSFNLGIGKGISVKELIQVVEMISKKRIAINWAERRAGDPSILVADPSKAEKILGWKPQYSSINTIVQSAYDFYMMQKSVIQNYNVQSFIQKNKNIYAP